MKRSSKAWTVIEMVLAMSITAVIALTIASVTLGLSASNATTRNSQQANRIATCAARRIQAALRKAKLITCAEDDYLAYWVEDTNGDGKINLAEVAAIKYNSDNEKIKHIRPTLDHITDETTKKALNVKINLDSIKNSSSTEQVLTNSPKLNETLLADNVTDFSFSATPDVPMTKLVTMYMEIQVGNYSMRLTSSSAIRADKIGQVGYSEEKYILIDE